MTHVLCRKLKQLYDKGWDGCSAKNPPSGVIINADDLGLCISVTDAICGLAEIGAITSTSLMATGPDFARAADWARRHQDSISIGVHLCLSDHLHPLTTPALQLADSDGRLPTIRQLLCKAVLGRLPLAIVRDEWSTQIRRVRDSGVVPTHLDSHQHVHLLPGLRDVAVDLAKSEGLALRHTSGPLYVQSPTCRVCAMGALSLARPAVWKSAALRILGKSLKRRLRSHGIPHTDEYISLSSLCSRFRGSLSGDALMLLADLASSVDGVSEWPVHPGASDAESFHEDPGWMSRVRLADTQVLGSGLHVSAMNDRSVELQPYRCVDRGSSSRS